MKRPEGDRVAGTKVAGLWGVVSDGHENLNHEGTRREVRGVAVRNRETKTFNTGYTGAHGVKLYGRLRRDDGGGVLVCNAEGSKFFLNTDAIWGKELAMAKKTGMSDSSLWIIAVVLVAIAAFTYLRR
jgi:hypothetical protein